MNCVREGCFFPMAPHDVLCVRHRSMITEPQCVAPGCIKRQTPGTYHCEDHTKTTSRAGAHVSDGLSELEAQVERTTAAMGEALIAKTRECERLERRITVDGQNLQSASDEIRALKREVEELRDALVKAAKRESDLMHKAIYPPYVLSDGAINFAAAEAMLRKPGEVLHIRETDNEPLSAWAAVGCAMLGYFGASALLYLARMLFA